MPQTVNQHWDPLKVCAVGRSYPPHFYSRIENTKVRTAMERIAVETEEDFQKLIKKLEEFNVKILRTDISKNVSDHWPEKLDQYQKGKSCIQPPPMTPRDHCAAVGNRFFMPSPRYGENIDVEAIYNKILDGNWQDINTPQYQLVASMIEDTLNPNSFKTSGSVMRVRSNKEYKNYKYAFTALDFKRIKNEIQHKILQSETNQIGKASYYAMNKNFYCFKTIRDWVQDNGIETVFDEYINTSCMTRIGKDLYFGFANKISKLNEDRFYEKMNRLFPDHRCHVLHTVGHTDGGFVPVKPGLILTVKDIQNYQDTFPDWEVFYIPEESSKHGISDFIKMKDKMKGRWWIEGEQDNDALIDYIDNWLNHWVTYVKESVFDTNMLVIDEKNAIVLTENPVVFKAFEKHGITPHVIDFRHRWFWDGGLHCFTTDIIRDGDQVDYFPERGTAIRYWPHGNTGSL